METKNFKQAVADALNGVQSTDEVRGGAVLEGLDIAMALIDGLGRLASALEAQNKIVGRLDL